jgi:predicted dienelactone hydrolase
MLQLDRAKRDLIAIRWFPPRPTGRWGIVSRSMTLAATPESPGPPIDLTVWVPVDLRCGPRSVASYHLELPPPPIRGENGHAVIAYLPGLGGKRQQNLSIVESLVSNGFVILGVDDLKHDMAQPDATEEDEAIRLEPFQHTSEAGIATTYFRSGERVRRQAGKVSTMLDRFRRRAEADWPAWAGELDPARVGALGYSFGGSTAAELAALDPRIRAAFNLDGWLFGAARSAHLREAYAFLASEDYALPTPMTERGVERFDYRINAMDRPFALAHAARRHGYAMKLPGLGHSDMTDGIFRARRFRRRWQVGADRAHRELNTSIVRFFDTYLKGTSSTPEQRPWIPSPMLRSLGAND